MTTGHVFLIDPRTPGFWGVLSYSPKTTVQIRIIETASVFEACDSLASQFAGRFIPADTDTAAWGRVIFKARGGALVLN